MFFSDFVRDILKIGHQQNMTEKEFIEHELQSWMYSPARQWQLDGDAYYHYRQVILTKERQVIGKSGKLETVYNLPNNRIMDNKYAFLVDQKANYLLAKPVEAKANGDGTNDLTKEIFGGQFQRTLKNVGKDTLNCGISYLLPYIDNGKLTFKRFKGYEILPFWADDEHTVLDAAARLYYQEVYEGETRKLIPRVEWYTVNGVQKFTFEGGNLRPEQDDITPYFVVNNAEGEKQAYNWGKVPLVPFKANSEEIPLIMRVKSLQDALNQLYSDFVDNMQENNRNTIIVIKNYDGQDLGEFRHNLSQYGAVKVRDDGGIDTLTVEVNSENYKAIMSTIKTAIIENGRGLDTKDDRLTGGTPNQMNIQSMYNDIDLDADEMEMEFQASLEQLMWFVSKVHPALNNVEFIFNRDVMLNETDTINNCKSSVGIISNETIISNHPWVKDTKEEQERLDKEKQQNMTAFGSSFGNTFKQNIDDPSVKDDLNE